LSISFDQAKTLAEKTVRGFAEANGDAFDIVSHEMIDQGWLFFYNSKEFIASGDPSACLVGNGPIFVDRSGAVKALPTAIPWQEAIKAT
jgi:hypothetical protein